MAPGNRLARPLSSLGRRGHAKLTSGNCLWWYRSTAICASSQVRALVEPYIRMTRQLVLCGGHEEQAVLTVRLEGTRSYA